MAITSTTFSAVRDLVAAKLREITGLTVFDNPTNDASPLPSVEIIWPRFRRPGVDEAEKEFGSVSLTTYWPLKVRVDADQNLAATVDSFSLLGQILGKFAADPSLGTTAADGFSVLCSVTDGEVDDDPVRGDSQTSRGYKLTLEIQQRL